MALRRTLATIALARLLTAQPVFFPLDQVKPGMRGTGKSVFAGSQIEEFQVEILGVLENVGPKQSLVLVRLSGGPLERTGVMQGMSGSPVYVDGKLLGALAMSFPFSKEPVAAVRPIQDMLRVSQGGVQRAGGPTSLWARDLTAVFPQPAVLRLGEEGATLTEIATPLSLSGFTTGTLDYFGPQLRALGLEPRQGLSGGGRLGQKLGDPSLIQPGSMISVQLLTGDMSVGADGTVTHVDGRRIAAFGHRFLAVGATELPFARAEVLTLLPSLASSFKISAAREWMGTITADRSAAVAGELGRRASLVPISLSVAAPHRAERTEYRAEMVNDPFLAPLLVQMAVYSAIDATEPVVGAASFKVRGRIEFAGGAGPIRLENMYTGDFGVPVQASLGVATPLAYALQNGAGDLKLRQISLAIDSFAQKKQMHVGQIWTPRREVRPGETVDLHVTLLAADGSQIHRKVTFTVPAGSKSGTLYFSVADGNTTNLAEYQHLLASPPKSVPQLIALLNALRGNTSAYVRVWRNEPSYEVQGEILPSPPPSAALILARAQSGLGGMASGRGSKLAEAEITAGDVVISGSRTIQVEVKE